MSLPATPLANEFVPQPGAQDSFPLTLDLCQSCGHLQLREVVDPHRLFSEYLYVSGTSAIFVRHFEEYAREVKDRLELGPSSVVVDVGSNDGTLLKQFRNLGIQRVHGVEPAGRIAAEAYSNENIPSYRGFFNRNAAAYLRDHIGAADVVTANNVFAHADDLSELASAARDLLHPDGEFVFEVSYLRDVVEKGLFDTIYHEHLSYHALAPLVPFFGTHGLSLYHAERVATHGGSVRCFASRARKAQTESLRKLVNEEHDARLFHPECYRRFAERIEEQGHRLTSYIGLSRKAGKRIVGFGAPAKLTTLMYAYHLEQAAFDAIIDDAPLKQGLFTPGKNIPVRSMAWLEDHQPDVVIVFAWNFFDAIVAKLSGRVQCTVVNSTDCRRVLLERAEHGISS